jgi:hypothetical protein
MELEDILFSLTSHRSRRHKPSRLTCDVNWFINQSINAHNLTSHIHDPVTIRWLSTSSRSSFRYPSSNGVASRESRPTGNQKTPQLGWKIALRHSLFTPLTKANLLLIHIWRQYPPASSLKSSSNRPTVPQIVPDGGKSRTDISLAPQGNETNAVTDGRWLNWDGVELHQIKRGDMEIQVAASGIWVLFGNVLQQFAISQVRESLHPIWNTLLMSRLTSSSSDLTSAAISVTTRSSHASDLFSFKISVRKMRQFVHRRQNSVNHSYGLPTTFFPWSTLYCQMERVKHGKHGCGDDCRNLV